MQKKKSQFLREITHFFHIQTVKEEKLEFDLNQRRISMIHQLVLNMLMSKNIKLFIKTTFKFH